MNKDGVSGKNKTMEGNVYFRLGHLRGIIERLIFMENSCSFTKGMLQDALADVGFIEQYIRERIELF